MATSELCFEAQVRVQEMERSWVTWDKGGRSDKGSV